MDKGDGFGPVQCGKTACCRYITLPARHRTLHADLMEKSGVSLCSAWRELWIGQRTLYTSGTREGDKGEGSRLFRQMHSNHPVCHVKRMRPSSRAVTTFVSVGLPSCSGSVDFSDSAPRRRRRV
jgi:hypothetical protein